MALVCQLEDAIDISLECDLRGSTSLKSVHRSFSIRIIEKEKDHLDLRFSSFARNAMVSPLICDSECSLLPYLPASTPRVSHLLEVDVDNIILLEYMRVKITMCFC